METAIICPLKRSHTQTHKPTNTSAASLQKLAREIVEADLAEKITNDLSQTDVEAAAAAAAAERFSASHPFLIVQKRLCCSYMQTIWIKDIALSDGGDCNCKINHKRSEWLKVRWVRRISPPRATRENSVKLETSAASASAERSRLL